MNEPMPAIPSAQEIAERFNVLQDGHPALREPAKAIGDFEGNTWATLAEAMLILIKRCHAIGLAAPQVGVPAALVVCWVNGTLLKMANPYIYDRKGTSCREEGCLSVSRGQRRIKVIRSRFIKVRYQDVETGEWKVAKCKDLMATCVQHEIDHLSGILITDKTSVPRNNREAVTVVPFTRERNDGDAEVQEGGLRDREVSGSGDRPG